MPPPEDEFEEGGGVEDDDVCTEEEPPIVTCVGWLSREMWFTAMALFVLLLEGI